MDTIAADLVADHAGEGPTPRLALDHRTRLGPTLIVADDDQAREDTRIARRELARG
jgi:hypothetical protein